MRTITIRPTPDACEILGGRPRPTASSRRRRDVIPRAVRGPRYRLRRGSGGTGYSPGGECIERDLQLLEDCTVSLITERRVSRPWGLWGGAPGARGENWLLPAGEESRAERLPDKCTIRLQAGDVLRMLTPAPVAGAGQGGLAMGPACMAAS